MDINAVDLVNYVYPSFKCAVDACYMGDLKRSAEFGCHLDNEKKKKKKKLLGKPIYSSSHVSKLRPLLAEWLTRPPRERKIQGLIAPWDFSGSSHTSDLEIGTPVATLLGAWFYRISAGTGWRSVSILWLGEVESLMGNLYLTVAACILVWADPSQRYTSMFLGH